MPVEYGGLGLSAAHQQIFREEGADYRMPEEFGNAFNVVLPTLLAHGSEEVKKQYIPHILNGDHIWCQFLSEPSGGSDLAGLLTRAERDGDTWRLNGSKIWTTGGNYSDYAICLARTNPEVPKHSGLTMFIVPVKSPGITVVPLRLLDGSVDFCQEYIEDAVIPARQCHRRRQRWLARGDHSHDQRAQRCRPGAGLSPGAGARTRRKASNSIPACSSWPGRRAGTRTPTSGPSSARAGS